jgi:hypothetical protein
MASIMYRLPQSKEPPEIKCYLRNGFILNRIVLIGVLRSNALALEASIVLIFKTY